MRLLHALEFKHDRPCGCINSVLILLGEPFDTFDKQTPFFIATH